MNEMLNLLGVWLCVIKLAIFHTPSNRTPILKIRSKMKKFDDLMQVKNEIQNISASEAKDKLNDPNVQFIDVRDKEVSLKAQLNAINLDKKHFLNFI